MNHSLPGVNAGYITRNKLLGDHLRLQQELISHKIIEAVVGKSKADVPRQPLWPTIPSRRVLADVLRAA